MVGVVGVCLKGRNVLEGGGRETTQLCHICCIKFISSRKILPHQPEKDD